MDPPPYFFCLITKIFNFFYGIDVTIRTHWESQSLTYVGCFGLLHLDITATYLSDISSTYLLNITAIYFWDITATWLFGGFFIFRCFYPHTPTDSVSPVVWVFLTLPLGCNWAVLCVQGAINAHVRQGKVAFFSPLLDIIKCMKDGLTLFLIAWKRFVHRNLFHTECLMNNGKKY